MANVDDVVLIRNFLDGDVGSFNRLAWRWQERLFQFAYRYLMDEEDAKEAVQAVLIKVYKYLKKLKDPEKFSSWIYQITINQCRDFRKSAKKNQMHPFTEELTAESVDAAYQSTVSRQLTPTESAHQKSLGELIQMTLARLPEEQRIVIIMKEYEGFKFVEIAELLNVPINTVKSRLYHGLMHMQKLLKQLNIDKEVMYDEL